MPTYNGAPFIRGQLASILAQLSADDEVIVSDDSSSDDTVAIVKSFEDRRITLLEAQQYGSPIFNLENALRHARGDVIMLADQDDTWLPGKVERSVQLIRQGYDTVVTDCVIVNEEGTLLRASYFEVENSKPGFFHNLYSNCYLGCCMAFNRKILRLALPFPKNIPMHDIWIGAVSEVFGRPYFCREKLLHYRRHDRNASLAGEKSHFGLLERAKFRYQIVSNIVLRWLRVRSSLQTASEGRYGGIPLD